MAAAMSAALGPLLDVDGAGAGFTAVVGAGRRTVVVVTTLRWRCERETVGAARRSGTVVRTTDSVAGGSFGFSSEPRSVMSRYEPGLAVMPTTVPRPTLRGEPSHGASP